MDPILSINTADLHVQPDGEARLTATVANVGELVEQYRLEVLGEAARWSEVSPRQISVLPQNQEQKAVEVVFRPTSTLAIAGPVAFGLRCVSLEDPERCAVAEGTVTVAAVRGLRPRLEPVSPGGRWTGRYVAVFDNTGTVPVTLRLSAEDARRALRFALAPNEITIAPGQSGSAYLSVRPRQPRLRGKATTHQFTVNYSQTDDPAIGVLAGSFEQRPIVGKLVMVAAAAAAVVVAAGAVLLLRQPGEQEPAAAAGAPPPVAVKKVTALTSDSVQVQWERSPYAAGYLIQKLLPNGTVDDTLTVDDRDQVAKTWPGLQPGRHCFVVLAVGADKARSAPTRPMCATLTAPSASASAEPSDAAASGSPSDGAGPGGQPSASSGPVDPNAEPVVGPYVIYLSQAVDDTGANEAAQRMLIELQKAGIVARIVDSRTSQRLFDGTNDKGNLVVIQDRFPDQSAATAQCNAHRNIAPSCFSGN